MHRKILISAALVGTAAYLVAQAVSPGARRVQATPQGGGESAAIAQKVNSPANAAQEAIRHVISAECNYLIDKAKSEYREQVVSYIIEAQCYHMLTVMSDAQRDHEIRNVWAVDKWQPNGKWAHVIAAPKKARALLSLSPDQEKKIAAIHEGAWNKHMAPYKEIEQRLQKAGFTGETYRLAYNDELAKFWGAATPLDKSAKFLKAIRAIMAPTRELLTPEQRSEWDAIVAGYTVDMRQAFEGSKSPPDSK